MSGFKVNYQDVNNIATQQWRLSEHAGAGRKYIEENTELPFDNEGIINLIAGGHRDVRALAEQFHDTLRNKVAIPAMKVFSQAGDYYHATDDTQAEKLDRTYPPSNTEEAKKGLEELPESGSSFDDLHDPTARYTEPKDYSGEFPYKPEMADVLSATALYRDAIWAVTSIATQLGLMDRPYDVMESIVKPLSGDWAGLRACADVYENVGLALRDMSENVQATGQRLGDSWGGNAADSAQVYLFQLAKSLAAAEGPFHELAGQYETAAEATHALGKIIGVLLCNLIDAVMIAIAAAAGIAISASTIVAIPAAVEILDAAALAEIVKVVQIMHEAMEIVHRYHAAMETLESWLRQFGRIIVPENMPRLDPSGPANLPRLPR